MNPALLQSFVAGRAPLPAFGLLRAARYSFAIRSRALFQLRNNPFRYIADWFRGFIGLSTGTAGLHFVYAGTAPLSPIRDECRPVAITRIYGLKFTNALCCSTGPVIAEKYNIRFHTDQHGVEAFETCAKVACRENRK